MVAGRGRPAFCKREDRNCPTTRAFLRSRPLLSPSCKTSVAAYQKSLRGCQILNCIHKNDEICSQHSPRSSCESKISSKRLANISLQFSPFRSPSIVARSNRRMLCTPTPIHEFLEAMPIVRLACKKRGTTSGDEIYSSICSVGIDCEEHMVKADRVQTDSTASEKG